MANKEATKKATLKKMAPPKGKALPKRKALSTKKATPRKKAAPRKKIMAADKRQGKNWIITTSAERSLKDIAKDLEKAGFSVGNVNDEIQSITGTAGDESVERLRKVSGVVDVSPDHPISIGPPGSSDTW